MNRTIACLTLLCGLSAAWTVNGQESAKEKADVITRPQRALIEVSFADEKALKWQMYEDIEIMRRIMDGRLRRIMDGRLQGLHASILAAKSCTNCHSGMGSETNAAAGDFLWKPLNQEHLRVDLHTGHVLPKDSTAIRKLETEGTYLKGHGVVYHMTLPPMKRSAKPEAKKSALKPLSEWQRVRKQLRGEKLDEKAEADAKNTEKEDVDLAEILLKALAENGDNFSQLSDNEALTLIITFRESIAQTIPLYGIPVYVCPPSESSNDFPSNGPAFAVVTKGTTKNTSTSKPQSTAPTTVPAKPSSAKDYELLGDLHQGQGRHEQAIDAYGKAVAGEIPHKQRAAIHRKLAQSYLSLGKDALAKERLGTAIEYQQLAESGGSATTSKPVGANEQSTGPLPAKLIISAPKKLLDQVASGKISFEEFKKQATVEHLTFADPKKDTSKEKVKP